jgi:hypothetical protein
MCPHLWIKYHFVMEEFPGFSCSINEHRRPIGRCRIGSLSKEKCIKKAEAETRSNLGKQEEHTKDDIDTIRTATVNVDGASPGETQRSSPNSYDREGNRH